MLFRKKKGQDQKPQKRKHNGRHDFHYDNKTMDMYADYRDQDPKIRDKLIAEAKKKGIGETAYLYTCSLCTTTKYSYKKGRKPDDKGCPGRPYHS